MSTIREKLAELRNIARAGGNVDLAEFIALESQAATKDKLDALAAEGEAARAEEATARERAANIATAQATARDLATTAKTEFSDAYAEVVAAVIRLVDTTDHRREALTDAVQTLGYAGAPRAADPEAGPVAALGHDTIRPAVVIDGTHHVDTDPGEAIRCAIHEALSGDRYRDRTGAPRRFPIYGGTDLLHKLGQPDRNALPK